jgi:hypothetical protein
MSTMLEDIRQYEDGPNQLEAAVAGLSYDQLHARPGPGDWSIHEVVIHVTDSDAVAIERMKRIVAMESPALLDYDESAFIRNLHPKEQSLEDALTLFRVNRRQWVRVLRCLTPADFARVGQHSVSGPVTLGEMIPRYVQHLNGHLRFIADKRVRL